MIKISSSQKGAISTENLILIGLIAIALIIGIAKYGGQVEEEFGGGIFRE